MKWNWNWWKATLRWSLQRRIQMLVKHLKWSVFTKIVNVFHILAVFFNKHHLGCFVGIAIIATGSHHRCNEGCWFSITTSVIVTLITGKSYRKFNSILNVPPDWEMFVPVQIQIFPQFRYFIYPRFYETYKLRNSLQFDNNCPKVVNQKYGAKRLCSCFGSLGLVGELWKNWYVRYFHVMTKK